MKLKELWKLKFDKIFILTCTKYPRERLNNMLNELHRVGITDDMLFIKYSVDSVFKERGFNAFKQSIIDTEKYPNQFNFIFLLDCAYNHYEIYKLAKYFNYKHILIIEDDLRFLKDLKLVKKFLKISQMIMIFVILIHY